MPQLNRLRPPGRRPVHLSLSLLTVAVLVVGCARLPVSSDLPQLQSAETFSAHQTLQAAQTVVGPWPAQAWWNAYGDRQLDALIDEALLGAPDLQVAAARLQRAEAFTQSAGSALKPQVAAHASASVDKLSYNHLIPRTPATEGWNGYGRATLDVRWELDFWGQHRAGLSAATSELEARRAELAQARLVLASTVASEYVGLGQLHARRALAVQSVAVRDQTVQLTARRHTHGLDNEGSVRVAEAARAAAEGMLLALDEQIVLQRHRLAALLGQGPDRGLTIQPPQLQPPKAGGLPDALPAELLGRRPDVVAARRMAQAQASRIGQKEAEFYPNVNLSAFIGVQSLGLDMLGKSGSAVGSVGPAISLPIFSGGRLQGELRGAQAAYAESVARYNATVVHALQEVADAAVSLKAMAQRLDKAQEGVDAATRAHRLARLRHEGGLASALDVLRAEDALIDSQTWQTEWRARAMALDVALHRALGGGYRADAPQTLALR